MMKLAVLRNPVRHLAGNVSTPRQARTLQTCPVVMRKASQGSGSGEEERNLPATSQRGRSLGLTGLSSPFSSRFREMEQEMEVSFLVTSSDI